eukprot:SAG31_NODE_3452_length_4253_cov_10.720270_4_plen_92_part_00
MPSASRDGAAEQVATFADDDQPAPAVRAERLQDSSSVAADDLQSHSDADSGDDGDDKNDRYCRICYEGSREDDPLFSPCMCKVGKRSHPSL